MSILATVVSQVFHPVALVVGVAAGQVPAVVKKIAGLKASASAAVTAAVAKVETKV